MTQICWSDGRTCTCGGAYHGKSRLLLHYGRCRSGSRWFWNARIYTFGEEPAQEEHGWSETEDNALAEVHAAVVRLAAGQPGIAVLRHGWTSHWLKQINKEKRAARPPSDATDSRVVEYLYSWRSSISDWDSSTEHTIKRYQIIKRAKKRVFYLRHGEIIDEHGELDTLYSNLRSRNVGETGFVDRQKLEADGSVYNNGRHWARDDYHLYGSLEALRAAKHRHDDKPPDLAALKEAMAAAHPDRGGSNAAFIEARRIYVDARRLTRHLDTQTRQGGRHP